MQVGDPVKTLEGTWGTIVSFDKFNQEIACIRMVSGSYQYWSIRYLKVVNDKQDNAVDGPEVDILKAYNLGYLTRETVIVVLSAVNAVQGGLPCLT